MKKKMSNKTRILFVGNSLSGGGAERVFINIINSIDAEKADVRVLMVCAPEKSDIRTDVDVRFVPVAHTRNGFKAIVGEVNAFQSDVVFTSHGTVAWMLPAVRMFARKKFKIVTRVAVTPSELYSTGVKSRIMTAIARHTYRRMDCLVAQTDFMNEDIRRFYRLPSDRVLTVRNYVDFDMIRRKSGQFAVEEFSPGCRNIVAVGALYSVKGFDLLLEALQPIMLADEKVRLYILGEERYEPGYRSMLESLALQLGIADRVALLGQKSNPYPYIAGANLLVMSSRKEGFPNVVLEALSLGTPVVATDVVDFGGVISPGNGIVVRKGDVEAIRQGISCALASLHRPVKFDYRNFDYTEFFRQLAGK